MPPMTASCCILALIFEPAVRAAPWQIPTLFSLRHDPLQTSFLCRTKELFSSPLYSVAEPDRFLLWQELLQDLSPTHQRDAHYVLSIGVKQVEHEVHERTSAVALEPLEKSESRDSFRIEHRYLSVQNLAVDFFSFRLFSQQIVRESFTSAEEGTRTP
jgi:hypothetical protein